MNRKKKDSLLISDHYINYKCKALEEQIETKYKN